MDTARKGFPRKANDLKLSVQKFLNDNPRKNPFKENRPGDGWVKVKVCFLFCSQNFK